MKATSIFSKMLTMALAMASAVAAMAQAIGNAPQAGEIVYTFCPDKGNPVAFGNNKAEIYDVAIRMGDKSLVGKQVTGMEFMMYTGDGISGLKAWMTKKLTLSGKNNVPDITSQDVTPQEGVITVRFDQPYTITDEGLYVGYTFSVDALNDGTMKPLPLYTNTYIPDGLYMHTSRTMLKWQSFGYESGVVYMKVYVAGVDANSAGLAPMDIINTQIEYKNSATITVKNHGSEPLSNFDYTYTLNGQTESRHVDLGSKPLPGRFNSEGSYKIDLPAISEKGVYPLTVTIDKVNGVQNNDAERTQETQVKVYNVLPVHRAVLEEYTGTWCGWCPRGFVGLELMADKHPNDFVGMSYHNADPMEIMLSKNYPSPIGGYPYAWLDRAKVTDAMQGISGEGIEKAWQVQCEITAPAALNVYATLDDTKTKVYATSELIFPLELINGKYRLEYTLLSDGLHGDTDKWSQTNYYSGKGSQYPGMEEFTSKGEKVEGLIFNDVVILAPTIGGISGSVPANIPAEHSSWHGYTFNLSEAVSTAGESLVQDVNQLEVAVLLIDTTTGQIANARKVRVENVSAGVSLNTADNPTARAEYYDLQGRRLPCPIRGINIKRMPNGETVKIYKK